MSHCLYAYIHVCMDVMFVFRENATYVLAVEELLSLFAERTMYVCYVCDYKQGLKLCFWHIVQMYNTFNKSPVICCVVNYIVHLTHLHIV